MALNRDSNTSYANWLHFDVGYDKIDRCLNSTHNVLCGGFYVELI